MLYSEHVWEALLFSHQLSVAIVTTTEETTRPWEQPVPRSSLTRLGAATWAARG